jgi:hypothetical protein
VEKNKAEKLVKSDDRSFLKFTSKDMAQARAVVERIAEENLKRTQP